MKKRRLGRTGLLVSPLGMGGIPVMRLEVDHAVRVIRRAQVRGITLFDTAHKYNDSEVKMGLALEGVREKVVIATKSLARDAATMAAHVDLSLERLRTDRIDIYQHHQVAGMNELEAILAPGGSQEALVEARQAGKIDHIGICCHNLDTAAAAMRSGHFETVQVAFNFIEKEPIEEIFPLARELDIGLIGMKPLGGGLLRYARLCFGFIMGYQDIVPIPGMETEAQVDELVDFHEGPPPELTAEERGRMKALQEELGTRFCHRCEYCMPCPQEINIPRTLHFRSIRAKYSAEDALAWVPKNTDFEVVADCLECNECVARCPYDLEIPEMLKDCLRLFEETKAEVESG